MFYLFIKQIGLGNIFNPQEADFLGNLELLTDSTDASKSVINKAPNLYIDRVAQRSVINVTHHGISILNPKQSMSHETLRHI